jgi:4-azaleucine resistance transporter AzlC
MDKNPFNQGVRAALPIVFGYLPVGLTFGVLAQRAGFHPLEVALMSLLVYAGASQFLAVEMISKGMAGLPVIMATFFVNLRHLLMSSSLSLYFKNTRLPFLGLLSAQLTDESYAVAISKMPEMKEKPSYIFGLQITSQLAWVGGSLAGAFFGPLIKSLGYGLPFALPALFICLLVLNIRSFHHLWVAGIAGATSLSIKWVLPGNWYILLAAFIASGIGMMIETVWGKKP